MAVLLTDGFYEAANPKEERFSTSGVEACLHQHAAAPLPAVIERLHAAVLAFVAGGPQEDDLTALLVRRA
jgi:serine phosphatase RsbU (regulator of sigma subunit)